jgi:sigma-B regulation protein RsbU (phosphoserine phosphatase)
MPKPLPSSQELDKRLLELTALFEISRSLTATIHLNTILENILRIPMGHMLISRGMVLLKKGLNNTYSVEEIKGFPRQLLGKCIEVDNPPIHAVSIGEIDDSGPWKAFFLEFEINLILPLSSSRGVIGLIGFGPKLSGEPYEENEVEFLNSLSNIAATTVVNGLMVDEIQTVNRQLDRKIQQLNTIFDINREFNTTLDREKIASLLSFAVMGELLVNKCAVFVEKGGNMAVLVSKGAELTGGNGDLSRLAEPLFLDDTPKFSDFQAKGIALLVPMRLQDETKGILAVGSKISGGEFQANELEFLTTLGNQAMASLENARLFEEMLEKQRMEEELNLARSIQQTMLPSTLPDYKNVDMAAINISSREVGGDYYDVFSISDTVFGVAIGDVAGKGAGAALLMSNLQASLQALVSTDLSIEEVLCRVNQLIYRNTGLDKFITFFYGELDTVSWDFTYCNAGHNPPMKLNRKGELQELNVGGIVLGMMEQVQFETATVHLDPGDSVLLYTDGITEAMNEKEEEFSESGVLECLREASTKPAAAVIELIISRAKTFSGSEIRSDDMTMVFFRRQEH